MKPGRAVPRPAFFCLSYMPGNSSCALAGPANSQGSCTGTYSLTKLPSAVSGLSSSPVVTAMVGGAAILAVVLFAAFVVGVVGSYFDKTKQKKSHPILRIDDFKAADALRDDCRCSFDLPAYKRKLADLDMEDDAEDDTQDDSPADEVEDA